MTMMFKAIGRPIRIYAARRAYSVLPSVSAVNSGLNEAAKSYMPSISRKASSTKKTYHKIGDKDVLNLNPYQLYTLYNPNKDSKVQFVDELSFNFSKHASSATSSGLNRDAFVEELSQRIQTNSSALSPLELSSSLTEKYSDSILSLSLTATRTINKLWSSELKCWVPLSPPDAIYHQMDKFVVGLVAASDLINGLDKDKDCLKKAAEELKAYWTTQRNSVESARSPSNKGVGSLDDEPTVMICLVGWGPAKLKLWADNEKEKATALEAEIIQTSTRDRCLISEAMDFKEAQDLIWSMLGDFARKVQVDNERLSFVHTDPDLVISKGKSQDKTYGLMLQQIPSISAANAKAITTAYPTLRALMDALSTGEGLNIPKFPSEKASLIHRVLTTEDPNQIIDTSKAKVKAKLV